MRGLFCILLLYLLMNPCPASAGSRKINDNYVKLDDANKLVTYNSQCYFLDDSKLNKEGYMYLIPLYMETSIHHDDFIFVMKDTLHSNDIKKHSKRIYEEINDSLSELCHRYFNCDNVRFNEYGSVIVSAGFIKGNWHLIKEHPICLKVINPRRIIKLKYFGKEHSSNLIVDNSTPNYFYKKWNIDFEKKFGNKDCIEIDSCVIDGIHLDKLNYDKIIIKNSIILGLVIGSYDSLTTINSIEIIDTHAEFISIDNVYLTNLLNFSISGFNNTSIDINSCEFKNQCNIQYSRKMLEEYFPIPTINISNSQFHKELNTKFNTYFHYCILDYDCIVWEFPSIGVGNKNFNNVTFTKNVYISGESGLQYCTFYKNLICNFNQVYSNDLQSLNGCNFKNGSNLTFINYFNKNDIPLEILSKINIVLTARKYYGIVDEPKLLLDYDSNGRAEFQRVTTFPFTNEDFITDFYINNLSITTIEVRANEWIKYITEYESSNTHLKDELIQKIEFQLLINKLVFYRDNNGFINKICFVWYVFLYYTVHLGYHSFIYWLITSMLIILLISFFYFNYFSKQIELYFDVLGDINSEYYLKIEKIKNSNKLKRLLKDFFILRIRGMETKISFNAKSLNIISIQNNINSIIKCIWFTTLVYINPKLSIKYLNIKGYFFYLIIFNWVLGMFWMILFFVYIASKFGFVSYFL